MDWTVHYNMWSLDSGNHLFTIAWIVDPTALKLVFQLATKHLPEMRADTRFMFPVAFSQDLRQVVALNSVVLIEGPLESKPQARHSDLDIFNRLRPYNSSILDNTVQIKSWTVASRCLVVVFRQSSGLFTSQFGKLAYEGLLQFFYADKDENESPNSEYVCFASWKVDLPAEYLKNFLKESVIFHPHRSLVAFQAFSPFGLRHHGQLPERPQTFLWDFGFALEHGAPMRIPTRDLYRPCDGVIESIAFSADGQFMYGKNPECGYPVVLSIEECMKPTSSGSTHRLLPHGKPGRQPLAKRDESEWIITQNKENLPRLFAGLTIAPTQTAGALTFSRNEEGQAQISQLQQWEEEGAIVLKSLTVDGQVECRILSRLPSDLRCSTTATILRTRPDEDSNIVRMCLDKPKQNLYSLKHCANMVNEQLPAIVERSSSTIPARTYNMVKPALDDMHTGPI